MTSDNGKDRIEFSNIDLLLDVSRSPIMTDSRGGGSIGICVTISWDADPPSAAHSTEFPYYEHPDLQVTKEGEYLYRFKGSLVHEQEGSYDHASMAIKLRRSLGTGTYVDEYMPIYPMPD